MWRIRSRELTTVMYVQKDSTESIKQGFPMQQYDNIIGYCFTVFLSVIQTNEQMPSQRRRDDNDEWVYLSL